MPVRMDLEHDLRTDLEQDLRMDLEHEANSGWARSSVLRPLAARLRAFPLAYALSVVALAVAGIAWYLAQATPPESAAARAASSTTLPTAASVALPPAPPAEPPSDAVTTAPPHVVVSKPPIDVLSLPVAPPAQPALRTRPIVKPPQHAPAPASEQK